MRWGGSIGLGMLTFVLAVGVNPPTVAATDIDTTQSSYLASNLGTTVNPVFVGGVLKTDQASGSYPQNFTLAGSGNTIDQFGNAATFSGVIYDATSIAAGGITITNSLTGGSVTFTAINPYTGQTVIFIITNTNSLPSGSVTFTGINPYTGATVINSGATLALSASGSIAASSGLTVSGTFDISGAGGPVTINALTGAGAVVLGARTLTVAKHGGTFSGMISGAGGLTATGGGLWTLTGANSYAGGTKITGGTTLAIGSDSALGGAMGALTFDNGTLRAVNSFSISRSIFVNTGGGIVDSNGYVVSLNGPIVLNGALKSVGVGSVLFSNQAQGNGTLLISNGLFSNNGQIGAQNVEVASTGILRGTGLITAPTSVYGTLAPGNSPGTLTFNAPVTLFSGSSAQFDIDGTGNGTGVGNHSRVIVTGAGNALNAGGTLRPLLRGITGDASNVYVPPIGQFYSVISAAGGITGSFGGLAQSAGLSAGTRFDAVYRSTSLSLVITPTAYGNLGLAGLAETGDEAAVGRALDAIRPAAGLRMTDSYAWLFYPLYTLSGPAIAQALDQLSPAIYGDALISAQDGWYQMADSVGDQMAARRGNAASGTTVVGSNGLTFWTNGMGGLRRTSSSGTQGYTGTTSGAVVGVDMAVAPGAIAGIAVAGTTTATTSTNGARSDSEAFQFTIYGGWKQGIAFVDGQAGYSKGVTDVRRNLSFWGTGARGRINTSGEGAQVHAGLHLDYEGFGLEPLVGLSAVSMSSSGATETFGGPLAERISGAYITSVQSLLGLRVERTFALFVDREMTATALLGWNHEFGDVLVRQGATFGLGGGEFRVSTAPTARDSLRLGAGISSNLSDRVSLYVSYVASIASARTSQQATVGGRVSW